MSNLEERTIRTPLRLDRGLILINSSKALTPGAADIVSKALVLKVKGPEFSTQNTVIKKPNMVKHAYNDSTGEVKIYHTYTLFTTHTQHTPHIPQTHHIDPCYTYMYTHHTYTPLNIHIVYMYT